MINNDVLRRLRYALDITDNKVLELFALAGYEMDRPTLESMFKREEEEGYVECADLVLDRFLDGLVISRRGRREEAAPGAKGVQGRGTPAPGQRLTNNDILKRIRIALQLKDEDLLAIMALAEVKVSASELNALFRNRAAPNFRPCGDQFLRNFLVGLTAKYRP
jgi:uncharacterized protein YehS (DUF1456 family)